MYVYVVRTCTNMYTMWYERVYVSRWYENGWYDRRSHEKTGNHKHSENIERLAY